MPGSHDYNNFVFDFNWHYGKIVRRLAREYGISVRDIVKLVQAYWEFIRLSVEEKALQGCRGGQAGGEIRSYGEFRDKVNHTMIPVEGIGSLSLSYKSYLGLRKHDEREKAGMLEKKWVGRMLKFRRWEK